VSIWQDLAEQKTKIDEETNIIQKETDKESKTMTEMIVAPPANTGLIRADVKKTVTRK